MTVGVLCLWALAACAFGILLRKLHGGSNGRHRKTSEAGSGSAVGPSGRGTITFGTFAAGQTPAAINAAARAQLAAMASPGTFGTNSMAHHQQQMAMMIQAQQNAITPAQVYWTTASTAGVVPMKMDPLPKETKFGEIIGYRFWHLHSGFLKSASMHNVWLPNQVESIEEGTTIRDYGPFGIHAFKTEKACILQAYPSEVIVFGRIKMWGEVVEYEHGYHAEHAKIIGLDHCHAGYTIDSAMLLDQLRKKYGVWSG